MDANGLHSMDLITGTVHWDYAQACYWLLLLVLAINIKRSNDFSVRETALAVVGLRRFKKNGLFYVLCPSGLCSAYRTHLLWLSSSHKLLVSTLKCNTDVEPTPPQTPFQIPPGERQLFPPLTVNCRKRRMSPSRSKRPYTPT